MDFTSFFDTTSGNGASYDPFQNITLSPFDTIGGGYNDTLPFSTTSTVSPLAGNNSTGNTASGQMAPNNSFWSGLGTSLSGALNTAIGSVAKNVGSYIPSPSGTTNGVTTNAAGQPIVTNAQTTAQANQNKLLIYGGIAVAALAAIFMFRRK